MAAALRPMQHAGEKGVFNWTFIPMRVGEPDLCFPAGDHDAADVPLWAKYNGHPGPGNQVWHITVAMFSPYVLYMCVRTSHSV